MRPSWRMRRISVSKSLTFTGQVREVFHQATPAQGRRLAAHLVERLPTCPIPEIARLGRTLRKWKDAFLAYFDTSGASNGPTEAINGHYRAGQTHRQRLPQPHQLPTPNAPHRRRPRRLHPHSTLKSPILIHKQAPASSHKTGTRPGHQSARSALDERHSHSMVAGGLEVTSRTTRLTSGTELVMRVEMRARTS